MKSLFFSTATFAVAVSLATSAHASQSDAHVMPENDAAIDRDAAEPWLDISELKSTDAITVASVNTDTPLTLPALRVAPQINIQANAGIVTPRTLTPRYGDIDAFYGDIDAFYGDIDAFWGDINPFYGDINPFYGDINPFEGDVNARYGDISPFYGDIGAFWGDIDAFYGDIGAFDATNLKLLGEFWAANSASMANADEVWSALKYERDGGRYFLEYDGTPNRILKALGAMIDEAEAQFGAKYEAETGKSFRNDLVTEIFARHGVDLKNKTSLAGKSAGDRAKLFLDWHDTLTGYSGIDAVDHWMHTVNWTPAITQIQGRGKGTIIGIVDGSFAADADLGTNVIWSGGYNSAVGGHGVGVASLIAGEHDGQGVMGIAPGVNIASYNPFTADGTASYTDVTNGIISLFDLDRHDLNETGQVSIINLSLGEKGWVLAQGMADVLRHDKIKSEHNKTVFVIAAGNEGISQTANVELKDPEKLALILVGSVRPDGQISSFSNRPGSAVLLDDGQIKEGNEFFKRFIVAPGELILMSDGKGGVVRHSGTSFAAPLVSGAVSLLHDRWPWLSKKPLETTEIIFRSAQDLGAPGPDEVYGWGLLDVAASQSPLDFNQMKFKLYKREGSGWKDESLNPAQLLSLGIPTWWETNGVFFTAFEDIGSTHRDFAIPMSSLTRGQSTDELGNGQQRLQDFVGGRFAKWLLSGGKDKNGNGKAGISQVHSNLAETSGQWSMRFDAIAPNFGQDGAVRPVHNAATLTDPSGVVSFTVGQGQGALAISGGEFGMISDHNPVTGGVNPVLGFASGEMFAQAQYKLATSTTVSFGYSKENEDWEDLEGVSEIERSIQRQLGARKAEAFTVGIQQKLADGLTVDAQWTRLNEKDAILGNQTGIDAFLGEGSKTDALTLTASMNLGEGFSLGLSATGGATEVDEGQLLATSQRTLSTAGQFSINKRGLIGESDLLRVSIGQPLNIDRGELEFSSEQVVNRLTGERGVVTQTIGIETKRRHTAELVYAAPVSPNSEFGLIGRYISDGVQGEEANFMVGANFGLRF